jgi:exodeoxyribonuclease X
MRLRVIDIETGGLAPPAEICEIAFIDVDEAGQELARFRSFCNPFGAIEPGARAAHHIMDGELIGSPRWPQVLFHIRARFPQADVYVAHNSAFERLWLGGLAQDRSWLCTMKAALRVWPEAPAFGNQVLRYWLGIEIPPDPEMPAHRAMQDCEVTAAILRRLQELATIDEMIQWESEPAMFPRVTFGKYRGKPWAVVPADYLEWMLEQDFDGDRAFCARQELARRQSPPRPRALPGDGIAAGQGTVARPLSPQSTALAPQ